MHGPQERQGTANEVQLPLVFFRVFAVEIQMPAGKDAQEEDFWVPGFEILGNTLGQLF